MVNIQEAEIQVLSEILRFMKQIGCNDEDEFASRLTTLYMRSLDNIDLFVKNATKVSTNFFKVNKIKKSDFLKNIYSHLTKKLNLSIIEKTVPPLRFIELFPEIKKINDSEVGDIDKKLNIKEDMIQTALRDALREKGSSPLGRRGKDSSLEVADLEHFLVPIKGKDFSFSAVVKGYNSIKGKKVSWEDIAHQIVKAYRTKPNYILFLTTKELKDGVISEMVTYGMHVNNANLVVIATPIEVAKFLIWRKIIKSEA